VRPCVAFLSASSSNNKLPPGTPTPTPTAEDTLIPRLDAREVAAVFSAPFHNFLRARDEDYASAGAGEKEAGIEAAGFPAEWYRGSWTDWHESRWRMHNFYVPITNQTVTKPKPKSPKSSSGSSSSSSVGVGLPYQQHQREAADHLAGLSRFRVFGMTARILVDCARVAYAEEPEFEHNAHFGDEEMIGRLLAMERLGAVRKSDDELTREDMKAAAKL